MSSSFVNNVISNPFSDKAKNPNQDEGIEGIEEFIREREIQEREKGISTNQAVGDSATNRNRPTQNNGDRAPFDANEYYKTAETNEGNYWLKKFAFAACPPLGIANFLTKSSGEETKQSYIDLISSSLATVFGGIGYVINRVNEKGFTQSAKIAWVVSLISFLLSQPILQFLTKTETKKT